MAKTHLNLVTPNAEKRAVAPVRRPNRAFRKREHLTPAEVEKLIEATKDNRHAHRDATMILVAYRHGLRASEVVGSSPSPATNKIKHLMWILTSVHVAPCCKSVPSVFNGLQEVAAAPRDMNATWRGIWSLRKCIADKRIRFPLADPS